MKYIWERENWPELTWRSELLLPLTSQARVAQGRLLAKVTNLGFHLSREAQADILTEEALNTSAIEGEHLNRESVRSSVTKVSRATAFREISDLVEKGIVLQDSSKGGRSVSYDLNWD